MSFDLHCFCRPACCYPECHASYESECEWYYDRDSAIDEVEESFDWICLHDARGNAHFFCPKHVHCKGHTPIYFDPDVPEYMPAAEEALTDYYTRTSPSQPLPRPECESTILAILREGME